MFFDKLSENLDRLSSLIILMIVFLVPIWIKLAIPLIPLLTLTWILGGNWKKFIPEIIQNRFAQILILFWVLHLVGVLYSTNCKYGLLDVQQKLSFLLFPAIFITITSDTKPLINKVLNVFLMGSVISGIICLVNASYNSLSLISNDFIFNPIPKDALWENYFKYTRFSFLYHPSYLAMFFTFSVAIIFKRIKEHRKSLLYLFTYIILLFYFCILIYLLSSRAGLAALTVTIIAGLIWLFTGHIKWLLKIGLTGVVGLLIIVIWLNLGKKSNLINELNENIFFNLNPKKSEFTTNYDARFFIWQSFPAIMNNNLLFGYGTGDSHIALNKEYIKRNLVDAAQNDLNAHNQFLESLVSLGLLGLSFMIALIAYPAYRLLKWEDNFLPILFITIISINFLAESMLSRIAGIIFFALFYSFFFCLKKVDS